MRRTRNLSRDSPKIQIMSGSLISPETQENLSKSAMHALSIGEFALARSVFDTLFLLTPPTTRDLIFYAVCAAELGDVACARGILDDVRAVLDTLEAGSAARVAFEQLLIAATAWMPGGSSSKEA